MRRVLIVGIGSAHGDDQAGWLVIRQLQELLTADDGRGIRGTSNAVSEFAELSVECRQAQSPVDLLDWIEGHETLHIVDACDSALSTDSAHSTEPRTFEFVPRTRHTSAAWRDVLETGRCSGGTHGFDVLSVLDLTVHLGKPPERVVFWLVPGTAFERSETLSNAALQAVHVTVQRMNDRLRNNDRPQDESKSE